ncbi:hypothetical protein GT347_19720 [Xylophilus rhododendri]|uniref:Uncharacterized protein n=1 Tax=Xylophilus rhododendri TaxID=2697032 RepID=A0A857J9W7_9BURK|nr:hypothetical protein [Xylophilus rhododendri]QHJ00014.1 hypothetical protein GT347_19720 [Xylophilus rhododendri]
MTQEIALRTMPPAAAVRFQLADIAAITTTTTTTTTTIRPQPPPQAGTDFLVALHELNPVEDPEQGDVYYDCPSTFAEPVLDMLAKGMDLRWLNQRAAQAEADQAAHARLRQYVEDGGCALYRWRTAGVLIKTAVQSGLIGGINFGTFAWMVAAVAAARNHGSHDLAMGPTTPSFSASAAGRQIVNAMLGAVPGALGYAVIAGATAVTLRPLIDAIALLLSGGGVTSVVPVDPSILYPVPSPRHEDGRLKDGELYTAELKAHAEACAEVARLQSEMTGIASIFNIKYGTPAFGACHAVRLMHQIAVFHQWGLAPHAALAGALSALASCSANIIYGGAAAAERLGHRHGLGAADRVNKPAGPLLLPLFVTADALCAIKGEASPRLGLAMRTSFSKASRVYLGGSTLGRKLVLGMPTTALALFLATLVPDVLLPLGTLACEMLRSNRIAALAVSALTGLLAYGVAFTLLVKALVLIERHVRGNQKRRLQEQRAQLFRQALRQFAHEHPGQTGPLRSGEPRAWSATELARAFDAMDRRVLADIEHAAQAGLNRDRDPGADRRMQDAYRAEAEQVRGWLLAAATDAAEQAPQGPPMQRRTSLLEEVRAGIGAIADEACDAAVVEEDDELVTVF